MNPWLKRAPLLLLVGLGLFLWRGGFGLLPTEKTVLLHFSDPGLERVEVQLLDPRGDLLLREAVQGSSEVRFQVPLKRGTYRLNIFRYFHGQPESVWTVQQLSVGSEDVTEMELPPAAR